MTLRKWLWGGLALSVACQPLRTPKSDDNQAGSQASAGKQAVQEQAAAEGGKGGSNRGASAGSGGAGRVAAAGSGGKPSAGSGGSGSKAGAGGGDAPSSDVALSFTPKNVPADAALSAPGALVLNTVGCRSEVEIDTGTGKLGGCDTSKGELQFSFSTINQSDTSLGTLSAALIVTRRFVVEQGMRVTVTGNRPLIIVATEDAQINGMLQANAQGQTVRGGGFGATEDGQAGLGPGGGGKPNGRSGGAGGGFCGRGGDGGTWDGLMATGGKSYGNPENVPLIGGSSGSKVEYYTSAGGGAIQISAGQSLEVSALGAIHVGGGGSAWSSSGGGAGGAILLEAPKLRVQGHLAANGGGGAAPGSADAAVGADASADDQPALGGHVSMLPYGGSGGAGKNVDGDSGGPAVDSNGRGAGGGGGAGRIRLNAKDSPDLGNALISPAQDTPCFSIGKL